MKDQIVLRCLKVRQPIGEFFIASMESSTLERIAYADMCKLSGRKAMEILGLPRMSVDDYSGWQRKLAPGRVEEIKKFVRQSDACFPSGIILAVDSKCAQWDESSSQLRLFAYADKDDPGKSIPMEHIAKILDGQHRLAGLESFDGVFDLNVSIFIGLDVAEQAYIFSMVNLAQTKVNKSLVYELLDSAKRKSPQKLCHQIAVALDSIETSPFYKRIKRLGCATPNRANETITQATFVTTLLPFLSDDENADREAYAKSLPLEREQSSKTIFRHFMVDGRDMELTKILYNYFLSVKSRWPRSWDSNAQGQMLNMSNGFKALMRFLRVIYPEVRQKSGEVPSVDAFKHVLDRLPFEDMQFTVEMYVPGSAGESALFHALSSTYEKQKKGK